MNRFIMLSLLLLSLVVTRPVAAQIDCAGPAPTPYPVTGNVPWNPPSNFFDTKGYIEGQIKRVNQIMGIIPGFVNGNIDAINGIFQGNISQILSMLEGYEREIYHMGNSILGVVSAFLQQLMATFGQNFGACFGFKVVGVCKWGCLKVQYNWPTEVGDVGQFLTTSHVWTLFYQFMKPILESDAFYQKSPIMAIGGLQQLGGLLGNVNGVLGNGAGLPPFAYDYDLQNLIPEPLRFGHAPFGGGLNSEPHLVPAMAQALKKAGEIAQQFLLPNIDFLPSSLTDLGVLKDISPALEGIVELSDQIQGVMGHAMGVVNLFQDFSNISSLQQLAGSLGQLGGLAEAVGVENIPTADLQNAVNSIASAQNLFGSVQNLGSMGGVVGALNQAQQTSVQFTGETVPGLGNAATVLNELNQVAPLLNTLSSVNSPQALMGVLVQMNVLGQIPALGALSGALGKLTQLSNLASLSGMLGLLSQLNIMSMLGLPISGVLGELLQNPVSFFGAHLALAAVGPGALASGMLVNIGLTCHDRKLPAHVMMDSPFNIDFARFPDLSAALFPDFFRTLFSDPLMCIRHDIQLGAPIANALPHLSHALACIDPSLGFGPLPKNLIPPDQLCLPNAGSIMPFTTFVPNLNEEITALKQTVKTLMYSTKKEPGSVFPFNVKKSKLQFIDDTPVSSGILGGLLGGMLGGNPCFKMGIEGSKFKAGSVNPARGHQRKVQHWSHHKCCLCPHTIGYGNSNSG